MFFVVFLSPPRQSLDSVSNLATPASFHAHHHSLVIPSFDAVAYEPLAASLNEHTYIYKHGWKHVSDKLVV
jgi:hypothetical protein